MLQSNDRFRREPYSHSDLVRLIHPGSIAIVGATNRPGAFGLRTLTNLTEFEGAVYPVNPRYETVAGHRCYPSLSDLPKVPDCAVIAVGRDQCEEAVADCVRAGVGGIIMYAAGFAETQRPDLVALQERLVKMVAGSPTRLLGPNCLGITNYAAKARILFGRMPVSPPIGPDARSIGIVTQSGSVSMSLGQAAERGVSISHAIPVGNGSDVGIADLISYLAEDKSCSAIACVFEGVDDPERLVRAAEMAFHADKPLVVYKMAVGAEGAAAALSHTGSLAGSHEAYKAALERAGAVIVERLEDVVETTAFFAKAGRPTGAGAAVVLGSGGLGVIAADMAEEFSVPLPQPEGETLKILQENVPEFGAARNPCDVTAQALNDVRPLEACAGAMLADPVYSTLLVVHPYADEISSARVPLWASLAEKHGKVVCNYWSTEALQGHGAAEVEAEPAIATFRSLARCFSAISAWHAREDVRKMRSRAHVRIVADSVKDRATARIVSAKSNALSEREAMEVLSLYGVPVVGDRLVNDAQQAVEAAASLGFPVVLKVESPDILHKTEAGVVRLNLKTDEEVRSAYREILARAQTIKPAPSINGVLVQPMVPAGIELMMGAKVDPAIGPLVVVGLGGIMVELMKDTTVRPAPVSIDEAKAMLRSLKGASVLDGFRGMLPVDVELLAESIARFSEFVADQADHIAEVDVNPIICKGSKIVAVDALIVRTAPLQLIEPVR